jgi:uncharacterized protein YggT (Ycf19 family)
MADEVVVPIRSRPRSAARASQVIDFLFGVLYALLLLRLLLVFIGARTGSGFYQLVASLTDPFYAPFRGIVSSPTVEGGFTVAVPILVALFVYALLHLAIRRLLILVSYRRTDV